LLRNAILNANFSILIAQKTKSIFSVCRFLIKRPGGAEGIFYLYENQRDQISVAVAYFDLA
jgi:hypothetical protein